MNRIWLGVALMVLLLIIGFCSGALMDKLHAPIADLLTQAADAALAEDWQKNTALITQARAEWERCRDLTAAISDQRPMDEISQLFAALQYLSTLHDTSQCSMICIQLSQMIRRVGESHCVSWPNLL